MLIKDPKVFIFLIPFVAIVAFIAIGEKKTPLEFSADGRVNTVEATANHGSPILSVSFNSPPYSRQFFPTQRFLTESGVKVGDHFSKGKNSQTCIVNGAEFQCVN